MNESAARPHYYFAIDSAHGRSGDVIQNVRMKGMIAEIQSIYNFEQHRSIWSTGSKTLALRAAAEIERYNHSRCKPTKQAVVLKIAARNFDNSTGAKKVAGCDIGDHRRRL